MDLSHLGPICLNLGHTLNFQFDIPDAERGCHILLLQEQLQKHPLYQNISDVTLRRVLEVAEESGALVSLEFDRFLPISL